MIGIVLHLPRTVKIFRYIRDNVIDTRQLIERNPGFHIATKTRKSRTIKILNCVVS